MSEAAGFYGKLLPSFFYGATGMALQALGTPGKDALILGAFLMANEWANMIGLYELSIGKLARALPVLSKPAVTRSFALLDKEQFAHYDEPTEFVWVREMARVRMNLINGQKIANPRVLAAGQNCYQRAPLNPFLGPFFDRYHVELDLKHRRVGSRGSPNGSANTSATASANASPNGSAKKCQVPVQQVPVQAGTTGSSTAEEQDSSTREEQPPLARRFSTAEPASFQTLCAIASEVLATCGDLEDLGDYRRRVKDLCAKRQRDYSNIDRLRSALDAALAGHLKRNPAFRFTLDAPAHVRVDDRAPERFDPTVRVGSLELAPAIGEDDLIPVSGSAIHGSATSISDLAAALKTDNVDDFNTRIRQLANGHRRN